MSSVILQHIKMKQGRKNGYMLSVCNTVDIIWEKDWESKVASGDC